MANSYQIEIGDYISFETNQIDSLDAINAVDIVGAVLSVDECTPVVFFVKYDAELFAPRGTKGILTSDGYLFATNREYSPFTLSDIPRGTPVRTYINGVLRSVYYYIGNERTGETRHKIKATSGIGLLDNVDSVGGLWIYSDGYRIVDAIRDFVGGEIIEDDLYLIQGGLFDCQVEKAVGNQIITGHLPYASARENLHWLIMAYGFSCTKSESGQILFSYVRANPTPEVISEDKTYTSGSIVTTTPKSQISVEEFTFIASETDEEIVLYDSAKQGSATGNITVVFNEPCHSLVADGVTIVESNCNYAIVSGGGTLSGKKYSKVSRLVIRGDSPENVASIKGVEIINPLNSANVADRLYSYYTEAQTVKSDFVLENEKCGRQYTFTDVYGAERTGFATQMHLTPSGNVKANTKFVCNYTPQNQGNKYEHCVVLTGSGTWNVPDGVTDINAILIGGGDGSDGAFDGENGKAGSVSQVGDNYSFSGSMGGKPGDGTEAALGGKVLSLELTGISGSFNYDCGVGGLGGLRNGGKGQEGTATTFGTYSSDDGERSGGIINLFTGDVYAKAGELDGINGAKGGDFPSGGISTRAGDKGQDVSAFGGTYYGANGYVTMTGWSAIDHAPIYQTYAGGGAAYGTNATSSDGATPISFRTIVTFGSGGNGANGGSGGGGGGFYFQVASGGVRYPMALSGGIGSHGNPGNNGGNGCIIIYY